MCDEDIPATSCQDRKSLPLLCRERKSLQFSLAVGGFFVPNKEVSGGSWTPFESPHLGGLTKAKPSYSQFWHLDAAKERNCFFPPGLGKCMCQTLFFLKRQVMMTSKPALHMSSKITQNPKNTLVIGKCLFIVSVQILLQRTFSYQQVIDYLGFNVFTPVYSLLHMRWGIKMSKRKIKKSKKS